MKILDLCPEDRPREKMLRHGAGTLSNAELIAILLRTGTGGKNAIEIAQAIMAEAKGSLTGAARMSIQQLCRINGVGPGKAIGIAAALELGKRLCSEEEAPQGKSINTARDVFVAMRPIMHGLQREECWVLYLSRRNKVLAKERLSIGGATETVIDIKLIVRRAIDLMAVAVIITHNHPSGDPHPGVADIRHTKSLKQALETFNISLVDHVIISDTGYYSFSEDDTPLMSLVADH